MKSIKIQVKATGEVKTAIYTYHRGNMRYNVDGIFYTDKNFDKLFKIVSNNDDDVCKAPYYLS